MKLYLTIIKDINKLNELSTQCTDALLVADKQWFINSINQMEQQIKIIKDKCNEQNNI